MSSDPRKMQGEQKIEREKLQDRMLNIPSHQTCGQKFFRSKKRAKSLQLTRWCNGKTMLWQLPKHWIQHLESYTRERNSTLNLSLSLSLRKILTKQKRRSKPKKEPHIPKIIHPSPHTYKKTECKETTQQQKWGLCIHPSITLEEALTCVNQLPVVSIRKP